jgi:hypothetical protein
MGEEHHPGVSAVGLVGITQFQPFAHLHEGYDDLTHRGLRLGIHGGLHMMNPVFSGREHRVVKQAKGIYGPGMLHIATPLQLTAVDARRIHEHPFEELLLFLQMHLHDELPTGTVATAHIHDR